MQPPDITPLPSGYHRRMHEVELHHWWHQGMLQAEGVLLGDRLVRREQVLLDAGCGTGGFLLWAASTGAFTQLFGFDPSAEAVELARERVPDARVSVGEASRIVMADASVDVVVCNDVLQHIHENDLPASVLELARVVRPGGVVLVRTNGARRARHPSPDWRLFDAALLRDLLEDAGLRVERLTHVNAVLSAWGAVRGRAPRAPDATRHGIPAMPGALANRVGSGLLSVERWYLRRPGRTLPYGHTLLALATRPT